MRGSDTGLLDQSPSRLRIQSGICAAPSLSHISLHPQSCSPHPPSSPSSSPPAGPSPNQVLVFCSFNKGTEKRGKESDVGRFVGRVDQCQGGLRTDRVSDCFDGQTLRFFPLPRRLYIILLFAPEIRSRLFLFHRPMAILPYFGIITILRYSWNDYCLSIMYPFCLTDGVRKSWVV